MTTFVVLLRAINVGGRNKIPMADLRSVLGEAGLDDVATYIQSGNLVCSSDQEAAAVSATVASLIADEFGHDIGVITRTSAEVDSLIAGFPYPDADPKQSGVVFLAGDYSGALDADRVTPDEFTISGQHVYVNCPTGFGQTKLTNDWIEKQSGLVGTRRNWNTVLRLADMAAAI